MANATGKSGGGGDGSNAPAEAAAKPAVAGLQGKSTHVSEVA